MDVMKLTKYDHAGRPLKYTPEYVEELADKLLEFAEESALPLLCKFGYDNNINHRAFTQNPHFVENEKFRHAITKCKQALENKLVIGGLTNQFNPTIVIFTLKNAVGWRDVQNVEMSGPDGEPLSVGSPTVIQFIGVESDGTGYRGMDKTNEDTVSHTVEVLKSSSEKMPL